MGDGLKAVAVDASGAAYLAGYTDGNNFPVTTGVTHGSKDAVLLKLNAAGSALVYYTYFGGSDLDAAYGVAVDGSGNAVIAGDTGSLDLPIPGAFQGSLGGGLDGFVAKLNSTGTVVIYSTYGRSHSLLGRQGRPPAA